MNLNPDAIAVLRHLRNHTTLDGCPTAGAEVLASALCGLGYVSKIAMPGISLMALTTQGERALAQLDDPEPLLPLPAPPLSPLEHNVLLQLSGVRVGMRYSNNWQEAVNKLKTYRYLRVVRGLSNHITLTEAGHAYLREQRVQQ